jgi:hypothetical protein
MTMLVGFFFNLAATNHTECFHVNLGTIIFYLNSIIKDNFCYINLWIYYDMIVGVIK